MMRKMLLAAAVALFGSATFSVRAADVPQVNFNPPQYVFMCRTEDDLIYIVEGIKINQSEGRRRREAKRVPTVVGNEPACDYIKKPNGEYFLLSALTNLARVGPIESVQGKNLFIGLYFATDMSDNPMYILMTFTAGGLLLNQGNEYVSYMLGGIQ